MGNSREWWRSVTDGYEPRGARVHPQRAPIRRIRHDGPVTQTPAGWFPDPQQPGQQRYWDGAEWTAHTQPLSGPVPPPETSGKATTSLILGILSLIACAFFTGIPAMITGRGAMKEIDASGGTLGGRGLAQAGFWTGLVGTILGTCALGAVIALFAFGASLESEFNESCTTIDDGNSFSIECN